MQSGALVGVRKKPTSLLERKKQEADMSFEEQRAAQEQERAAKAERRLRLAEQEVRLPVRIFASAQLACGGKLHGLQCCWVPESWPCVQWVCCTRAPSQLGQHGLAGADDTAWDTRKIRCRIGW